MRNTLGGSLGFPVDIVGTVPLPHTDFSAEQMAGILEDGMRNLGPDAIRITRSSTRLDVTLVGQHLLVVPYNEFSRMRRSTFEVLPGEPQRLRFSFQTREAFVGCCVTAGLGSVIALAVFGLNPKGLGMVALVAGVFAGVFLGQYAVMQVSAEASVANVVRRILAPT